MPRQLSVPPRYVPEHLTFCLPLQIKAKQFKGISIWLRVAIHFSQANFEQQFLRAVPAALMWNLSQCCPVVNCLKKSCLQHRFQSTSTLNRMWLLGLWHLPHWHLDKPTVYQLFTTVQSHMLASAQSDYFFHWITSFVILGSSIQVRPAWT